MSTRGSARARAAASAALLATSLLISVRAGAAAQAAERLYVSDETGGNVVIVDPQQQRVLARIAVGKRPRGFRLHRICAKCTSRCRALPSGDRT